MRVSNVCIERACRSHLCDHAQYSTTVRKEQREMNALMWIAQVIGLAVMFLTGVGVVLRVASWAVDQWILDRRVIRRRRYA